MNLSNSTETSKFLLTYLVPLMVSWLMLIFGFLYFAVSPARKRALKYAEMLPSSGINVKRLNVLDSFFKYPHMTFLSFSYKGYDMIVDAECSFAVKLQYPGGVGTSRVPYTYKQDPQEGIIYSVKGRYYLYAVCPNKSLEIKQDLLRHLDRLCDIANQWNKENKEGKIPKNQNIIFVIAILAVLFGIFFAMLLNLKK